MERLVMVKSKLSFPTTNRLSVKDTIRMKLIFSSCDVFKIFDSIIHFIPIFMIHFEVGFT